MIVRTTQAGAPPRGGFERVLGGVLVWFALVALFWAVDTLVHQSGLTSGDRRYLYLEQVTSGLSVFLLIPVVLSWSSRLRRDAADWRVMVAGHFVGAIAFAFGHVVLMLLLRPSLYAAFGLYYQLEGSLHAEVLYEFGKDLKIYGAIVLLGHLLGRRGQADDATDPSFAPAGAAPAETGRWIETVDGDRLDTDNVRYVAGARNYVALYTSTAEHRVRAPLSDVLSVLEPRGFLRIHRSFAVRIEAAQRLGRRKGGGVTLRLDDGRVLPVSRPHVARIRRALASAGAR